MKDASHEQVVVVGDHVAEEIPANLRLGIDNLDEKMASIDNRYVKI